MPAVVVGCISRIPRLLPAERQKNKELLAKPRKKADETVLFAFASLASRLGFESEEIRSILRQSPDQQVARRTLLTVRKPERYRYGNLDRSIQQMTEIFAAAREIGVVQEVEPAEVGELVRPPARCGIPHDLDHDRDKQFLFLPTLHRPLDMYQTHVSSFFVRRSVYFGFFGQALAVDISQTRGESARLLELVTSGSRHSSEAQATELGEYEMTQARVAQLAAEEREKQVSLARLTRESQEQQEKLSNLTTKQRECETRLQQLARKEDAMRQLLREQHGRLERLASEEQERQATVDSLAERQRLEREKLDRVAEVGQEHGAMWQEERLRWAPLAAGESATSCPEEASTITTEQSEEWLAKKRRRRITQLQFNRLLETETPTCGVMKEPQKTVRKLILSPNLQ